jgi:hypothetical protein
MNEQLATVPAQPTFAEQVLAVDVPALARRIQEQGSRAAIQASTIEILAMAVQLNDLTPVASNIFDLFTTANKLQAETDQTRRRALRAVVLQKIDVIAAAVLALGYGKESTTTHPEK